MYKSLKEKRYIHTFFSPAQQMIVFLPNFSVHRTAISLARGLAHKPPFYSCLMQNSKNLRAPIAHTSQSRSIKLATSVATNTQPTYHFERKKNKLISQKYSQYFPQCCSTQLSSAVFRARRCLPVTITTLGLRAHTERNFTNNNHKNYIDTSDSRRRKICCFLQARVL